MIALIGAARTIGTGLQAQPLLHPTDHVFGAGERVGILAARGSGKSVIARMLSGIEPPDAGEVLRQGRVSWPVGFAGALHPDLTVADNLHLVARLLGEDPHDLTAFCARLAGIGDMLGAPMKTVSPAGRAALAFCLSMAVACDTYVADDTTGFGVGAPRALSEGVFEARLSGGAGLILLSSNPRTLAQFCTRVLVLIGGRLRPCPDADTAAAVLETAAARAAQTQGKVLT